MVILAIEDRVGAEEIATNQNIVVSVAEVDITKEIQINSLLAYNNTIVPESDKRIIYRIKIFDVQSMDTIPIYIPTLKLIPIPPIIFPLMLFPFIIFPPIISLPLIKL